MLKAESPSLQRKRDSVFWRLSLLIVVFCLGMIAATQYSARVISKTALRLDNDAIDVLEGYAAQAARLVSDNDPASLQAWLNQLREDEQVWAGVVDGRLIALGTEVLTAQQLKDIRFARSYRSYLSRRGGDYPMIRIEISDQADLIMRLPQRFHPWSEHALIIVLALYIVPAVLTLLFCLALYLLWVSPLKRISQAALDMQVSSLTSLASATDGKRKDELGVLVRSLDYLAQRLNQAYEQQRQMLRALSHEVRTPLSRLQVALESELEAPALNERVASEVKRMRELVERSLQLAWLEAEQTQLTSEWVDLAALCDMLVENVVFESGWDRQRLHVDIPPDCQVMANLDGLAQALENILRNAIRHAPAGSDIMISASAHDQCERP